MTCTSEAELIERLRAENAELRDQVEHLLRQLMALQEDPKEN